MKPFLILMALSMLLLGSLHSIAQSGHVYEDSSILYPQETAPVTEDKVIEMPVENNTNSETTEEETGESDTQLVNNRHFLSLDSVKAFRNDRQFAYAKNLDSFLQAFKKQQEIQKKKQAKKTAPADTAPSKFEMLFNAKATQYFLWGIAALFVLFVVFKLFFAGGVFQKSTAKSKVKIIEEEEAKPVRDRNYDAVIAKAMGENNYRLAVRYMYLQLLQRLAAGGAIDFAVDKTNTEYLRELTGKPYKEEVAALTRYYDYVWYGEFAIDAAACSKLESRFRNVVV